MKTEPTHQTLLDRAIALAVLALAAAVSLFSVRSNDVWWMLATGRHILEAKAFIYTDPFSFTLAGHPWSPQSYLSAIVFYSVHAISGAAGLVALRVVLVVATMAVSLRTLSRAGISWAASGVVAVMVVLIAHTRFTVRAHLFEYLFVAIMMGFLLGAHARRGKGFFVVPLVVQVLWTNMHASFLLGPALVGLYFAGEWIGERLQRSVSVVRPFHHHDWRRAALLFALVAAACFVNPNPGAFLSQPLGGEQRELISRFTLEWRSPFDPAIAAGNFHPYYEILLGLAALALLLNPRRIVPAAWLLIGVTAYVSLQSHRFRVEFALVALPLVCVLLRDAPAVTALLGRARRWGKPAAAAAALALVASTAPGRVEVGEAVRERYPTKALEFVLQNDVAHRPFQTIGFGSYMTWDLYGKRRTFIDGRNYDPALYRDFLAAQSNRAGLDNAISKYRLDAFIIPALETSDAGMGNIHQWLAAMPAWPVVYMDEVAYVYVDAAALDSTWVADHAYRSYHPGSIDAASLRGGAAARVSNDLRRATAQSPGYARLWLDLGLALSAQGAFEEAVEALEQGCRLDPGNAAGWNRLGTAALTAGRNDDAVAAFQKLCEVVPGDVRPYVQLAQALQQASRNDEAANAYERALAIAPENEQVHTALFQMYVRDRYWDSALAAAEETERMVPESHLGYLHAAMALSELGRKAESIERANQAMRVNPRVIPVHFFLARRYVEAGDYRKALERVESVLALDPTNQTALDMRGQLLKAIGEGGG